MFTEHLHFNMISCYVNSTIFYTKAHYPKSKSEFVLNTTDVIETCM